MSSLIALLDAAPAAGGPVGLLGSSGMLVPTLLVVGVFYFMLIRPQQKKQRDLEAWLKNLKKGDEVVTSGGFIGKISGLTDLIVTLELQEKVRVRVLRSQISGAAPSATATSSSTATGDSVKAN